MSRRTPSGPIFRSPDAFVEMLKRIVGMSGAIAPANETANSAANGAHEAVPPTRVLDGFGAFEPPPPTARPVPGGYTGRATAENPPGFYGPPEGLVAVNTLAPADRLASGRLRRTSTHRWTITARPSPSTCAARSSAGTAAAADRWACRVLARGRHQSADAAPARRRRHFDRRRHRRCAGAAPAHRRFADTGPISSPRGRRLRPTLPMW